LADQWAVDPDKATKLARIAGGRIGWAIRAAADPQVQETLTYALDMLFTLMGQDLVSRFETAGALAHHVEDLPNILEIWLTWWRDVVLLHTANEKDITHRERQNELRSIAATCDLTQTTQIIVFLEDALMSLQKNANTLLLLENVALRLPELSVASM
jgi:DNA polymerase-3 subunit delta'